MTRGPGRTAAGAARAQIRAAVSVTAGVGVGCALVGLAAVGARGLWSGLTAALVVLAFFTAGLAPLRLDSGSTGARMALLLGGYALRLLAVIVVLTVAGSLDALDRRVLGLTVIACSVAWVFGQATAGLRRTETLDVDLPTG